MMEFHISRGARDRYQFAEDLFSFRGNVVFANVSASREFAHRMNQVRDVQKHPERAVHAGALYAMGLIDEASHVLLERYRQELDPAVMTDALAWFSDQIGSRALDQTLLPGNCSTKLSSIRSNSRDPTWSENQVRASVITAGSSSCR